MADDGGSGALTINGEVCKCNRSTIQRSLALVRFDKILPDLSASHERQKLVVLVDGNAGDVVSTRFQAYFTETQQTQSTKRWGTNRIDQNVTYNTTLPIVATSQGFQISISRDRSSDNPTDYEAGCNVYDSGCGLFLNEGGVWKLAGHLIVRQGTSATEFTRNGVVSSAFYSNWIDQVLNEVDSDDDGLPDHFETSYGAGSDLQAAADADGDGMSNLEEWIADTDPTDATSYCDSYPIQPHLFFVLPVPPAENINCSFAPI